MMWVIYSIFAALDTAIYNLAASVYNLLIDISKVQLNESIFTIFADRIYAFLGIFMLFKISFSLIKYLIDPDSFSDKSKGGKKLLLNIIIVLFLIVITPTIFDYSRRIQIAVIDGNVLPKVIMGVGDVTDDEIKSAGKQMGTVVLTAFYHPACAKGGKIFATDDNGGMKKDSDGKFVLVDSCINGDDAMDEDVRTSYIDSYMDAYTGGSIWDLFFDDSSGDELVQAKGGNDKYVMNYTWLISSIVGALLLLIFVIFCIDVAIRVIKLAFLQLIAPIPIVSFISPESSKSGLFNKWLKECIKTYLDLFIRLAAIYFAIYIISLLTNGDAFSNLGDNILVTVFIILGALMFANQLPKLIEDLTGQKLGGFTLNPMNKIGQSTFASAAMGGIGGVVGGAAANTWALRNSVKKDGWNKTFRGENEDGEAQTGFKALRHGAGQMVTGLGGGISAGIRGTVAGLKGGGKGSALTHPKTGIDASNQARYNRDVFRETGYSWKQRRTDDIHKFAGVKNKDAGVGKYDKQMKSINREMENLRVKEQGFRNSLANYTNEKNISAFDFQENLMYKQDAHGNVLMNETRYNDKEVKVQDFVEFDDYKNRVEEEIRKVNPEYNLSLDKATYEELVRQQQQIVYTDALHEAYRSEYNAAEDATKSVQRAEKK